MTDEAGPTTQKQPGAGAARRGSIAEILREYWHRGGFELVVDLSEEVFRTEGGACRVVSVLRSNLAGGLPR